jgi:hypothetical protein
MRFLLPIFLVTLLANFSHAQTPGQEKETSSGSAVTAAPGMATLGWNESAPATKESATPEEKLDALVKSTDLIQAKMAAAQDGKQPDEDLKKQLDLLQKQLEVQQKIIKLLKEQVEKQPPSGAAVEKLQTKVATLENRAQQAAQRDQDLSQAVDNLTEHQDAMERNGPRLPATLKELFDPFRNNETPLSIYGSFIENYTQFDHHRGSFSSPDFAPYFLIQLNDQFLLEGSVDINNSGVGVAEAKVDWIVNDWLTVLAGRYITPIGYFNERLNHEWINRLPDPALMFRQVSPLSDTDGLQVRGACYLGCLPIKLEYELYGGNGLQLGNAPGSYSEAVDLEAITGGPDETDVRALGGRLGLWVPEWGFTAGISTYFNGRYSPAAPDQFNLWQLDLGYRKGDWDLRFEYADTYQQAASYIGNNVHRRGFYAQVAYRPLHLEHPILRNFEVVFRYSRVWFSGIDPALLDVTAFGTLVDVPVNRDQYTFGVNYYFYASLALRFAYEINHEMNGVNLHDNVFLSQLVWAF